MSGPKGVGVGVVVPFVAIAALPLLAGAAAFGLAAAVLRARAAAKREAERRRAALEARGSALLAELDEVDQRWQNANRDDASRAWRLGDALRDRIRAASDGRLENEAAETALDDIAMQIAKAQKECAAQTVMLQMQSALQVASSQAATSAGPNKPREQEERLLRRDAEQISGLLETLTAAVSKEERTAIEMRARNAIEAPRGKRRGLILQLRMDIQRTNAAAEDKRRMAQEAGQWREKLVGLEGSEVEELDAALQQVVDGEAPLPPNIEQTVREVYDRAAGDLKRAYALGVVAEELQNLGYVVETGFETASAEAPQMLLRKPDMEDDYHVSLQAGTDAMLNTRVVRETNDATAPRSAGRQRMDEQAEQAWCGDLAVALAAAAKRGVRANVTSRHRAGEIPVQAIAPLDGKPKRRRRRRRESELRSRAG